MTILFSTVDNGAKQPREIPYIHATVDGVRVRFIDRRDERYTGWRCDEHGDGRCEHTEAIWPFLGSKVHQRIRRSTR